MWKLIPVTQASPLATFGMAGIAVTMAVLFVIAVFFTARRHALLAVLVVTSVMLGERFTAADIMNGSMMFCTLTMGLLTEFPDTKGWVDRLGSQLA